ncbi:MAG: FKBP-type peptidyl-prolyl cis-trans isomerase [Gemmataceae bacterium]|nr:FKBP-type peptidyl-prolyl cis-trans isomerase [Gemmataceae bacterium]
MRRSFALALAAGLVLAAGGRTPADDAAEKEKAAKLKRPDLKSDKWKKLGDAGLESIDEKEGKGDPAKPGATIRFHYTGWLTDDKATMFGSSVKDGEPIEYPLGKLIKGWQEGVPGMKPGGVRVLKVPAALGYGPRQKGDIPPNSDLVFRLELLEVK